MILVVFLRATSVYHHYMMSKQTRNPIPFDQPATYQIIVQGWIDPTMSDLLGGMTISPDTVEADHTITFLCGELRDQASLAGVFHTLFELHLMVLSVKRMEN
jgi:hypothetical protein